MKKVVLSALLALGLCFGLAAAPEAGAPAGKSGKAAASATVQKAPKGSKVAKAKKAKAKKAEAVKAEAAKTAAVKAEAAAAAEAPQKFAGLSDETLDKFDTTWGIPTLWYVAPLAAIVALLMAGSYYKKMIAANEGLRIF